MSGQTKRLLTIAAVVMALGAALAWYVGRGRASGGDTVGSSSASGSAVALEPTPGSAAEPPRAGAIRAPEPPTLHVPPNVPVEQAFATEERDDEWAPAAETEIKRRFEKIRGGKLTEVACKKVECRLTVEGTTAEVGKTIADLEGERGLHGYAQTLYLTAPEPRADGSVVLRAFAQFER